MFIFGLPSSAARRAGAVDPEMGWVGGKSVRLLETADERREFRQGNIDRRTTCVAHQVMVRLVFAQMDDP